MYVPSVLSDSFLSDSFLGKWKDDRGYKKGTSNVETKSQIKVVAQIEMDSNQAVHFLNY
jgi:hypothetical protein